MGFPAARMTDMHMCSMTPVPPGLPIVMPCMPTVLIGYMPAARMTDLCVCIPPPPWGGDAIVTGAYNVLIGNLPAARMTDLTFKGGAITTGMPTVLIGMAGFVPPGPNGNPFSLGNFHSQQQSNSCVVATSRNMILHYTGVDVPEAQLRAELRAIMNSPNHNFQTQGINPVHAQQLLANHGVPSQTSTNQTVSDLDRRTQGGDPVMVGFRNPGHRVAVSGVETDASGNRTVVVMDPAGSYNGQPRRMSETNFNNRYNPNAIVIDPD